MTTLSELFDLYELHVHIQQGYVARQNHPTLPLAILNYTKSAQYERVWNNITTQCRGLIFDYVTGEVVARPFPKFFNYEEVIEDPSFRLPDSDPIVSEKMDGSLGIIYTYNGETAVATRGSFASDQALWATNWIRENYPYYVQPAGVTTLVEIIYPDNRIVVDYQGEEGLWLLGAIDNATGADIALNQITWWSGKRADLYWWDLDTAIDRTKSSFFDDDEGVVLTWLQPDAPSIRLKVKNPRYVELHRIVTGLSNRSVWEALATDTFDALIDAVPDEFYKWAAQTAAGLLAEYDVIYKQAQDDLRGARYRAMRTDQETGDVLYTRRDLARHIMETSTHPGLCFALEDGKDISEKIWAMLKPERSLALIIEDDG